MIAAAAASTITNYTASITQPPLEAPLEARLAGLSTRKSSVVTAGSAGRGPTDPAARNLAIQMYHEISARLLRSFDLAGTAVFATSGPLAAARARQTPVAFAFFALVTGIGGNTLSAVLMVAPVAWVHHPTSIVLCLIVALFTWSTPLAWWPSRAIDWFDAVGIAPYGA